MTSTNHFQVHQRTKKSLRDPDYIYEVRLIFNNHLGCRICTLWIYQATMLLQEPVKLLSVRGRTKDVMTGYAWRRNVTLLRGFEIRSSSWNVKGVEGKSVAEVGLMDRWWVVRITGISPRISWWLQHFPPPTLPNIYYNMRVLSVCFQVVLICEGKVRDGFYVCTMHCF